MANRKNLGPFEAQLLATLIKHPKDAYGVAILDWVAEEDGQNVGIGNLYTTLSRLEKKGFVWSFWGDPTPERGGRRKRNYGITASGYLALQNNETQENRRAFGCLIPNGA